MKRLKNTLNRRHFTQMAAAVSTAPTLATGGIPLTPSKLVSSAVAPATKGVSNAKLLWASLLSRTSDTHELVQVANGLGIPKQAAMGACARLNAPKLIAAHKAANFNRFKPISALKSDLKRRAKAALEVEAAPLPELDEHSPPDQVEVTVLDDGKVRHKETTIETLDPLTDRE